MRPKRVSNIRKFCSKHGVFHGFSWGGHRKHCQAKEVSEAQWYAQHKPGFDPAHHMVLVNKPTGHELLLRHKTGGKVGKFTVEEVTEMAGPKPKEAAPVSATVKLIHGLRDSIFDLDSEISRLSALVKGAEEKLGSLKAEREKIREAVKSLMK